MSEQFQRCRFWPRCRIHLGVHPPLRFSAANLAEMAQLHAQGWNYTEIARSFGANRSQVTRIIRTHAQRAAAADPAGPDAARP